MPSLREWLLWLCLGSVAASCVGDPRCPYGMKKVAGLCVDKDSLHARDGSADEESDAGVLDASSDAALESDSGPSQHGCAIGSTVYWDGDGDKFGGGEALPGCPGGGYVKQGGDCADDDATVSPHAKEVCNGRDDNCNGMSDEGVVTIVYPDADGDGHGSAADKGEPVCSNAVVPGKVLSHDDCDDSCATCNPDHAQETACDGKDDDCDGQVDDGLTEWFAADCDRDGHLIDGEKRERLELCTAPTDKPTSCAAGQWLKERAAPTEPDCDDANAKRYGGNVETCDLVDNDCNSEVDDGLVHEPYHPDCDNDKYPLSSGGQTVCGVAVLVSPVCSNYIVDRADHAWDCADGDPRAHPGAAFVYDANGIKGAHPGYDAQAFACGSSVTMDPKLPACPADGSCATKCLKAAPKCGTEIDAYGRIFLNGSPVCWGFATKISCR